MNWQEILKTVTLEVELKRMVKDGEYSHSKMAFAYKKMCKAGKDHVSEGLNGINLDEDLRYNAIGYALDSHMYENIDDWELIPKIKDESKQIRKLIQEGLEICKKAKQTKDEKRIEAEKPDGYDEYIRDRLDDNETVDGYEKRTGKAVGL
tara:strand:+ start:22 stop:471 length:450 start_codon:yes stop_codon:yes gene_type:complete